jgi:transglutaminase-like putative cysteine protease
VLESDVWWRNICFAAKAGRSRVAVVEPADAGQRDGPLHDVGASVRVAHYVRMSLMRASAGQECRADSRDFRLCPKGQISSVLDAKGTSVRLALTTHLDAPPELVWEHLQTSRLLEYVAAPMLRFEPLRPTKLPATWSDGEYEVKLRLFGWLPIGRQTMRVSRRSDGDARLLRDDGRGQLATTWDHLIRVEPEAGGGTRYTDTVEVRAGIFTFPIWCFAQAFYRHRQHRWRVLVRHGFDFESSGPPRETLADFEHPLVQSTAARLTEGATSEREKIARLFSYVRDDIKFQFPKDGDLVKASEVIRSGSGQCNTKGSLFLALCKAAGIRARLHFSLIDKAIQRGLFTGVAYWLMPPKISHSWIEVEIDGRWRRIDAYINDRPLQECAVSELNRRGWRTGFSVALPRQGQPAFDLDLNSERFSQMAAVSDDHGTYDDPAEYYASDKYQNRPSRLKLWLYRQLVDGINERVERLRHGTTNARR